MKRKLAFGCIALMCLLLVCAGGITGIYGKYTAEFEKNFALTVNNWQANAVITAENEHMYTSISNGTLNFDLPKKLGVSWGKFVGIEEKAFEGSQFTYTRIPDTVTDIHPDAFGGTTGIKTIVYNGDLTNAPWGAESEALVIQDKDLDGAKITSVTGSKSTGYTVTLDKSISTAKVAYCRDDGKVEYVTVSNNKFTIPATASSSANHFVLKPAKTYAFATLSSDGTDLKIYNRINSVSSTFTPDNMTGVTVYKYPNTLVNNTTSSAPSGSSQPEGVSATWDTLSSRYGSGAYENPPTTYSSKVKTITIVDNVKPASAATYAPPWFLNFSAVTTITGMEKMDVSGFKGMSCMFRGCRALTSLDLSSFNTEKVTMFYRMFFDCQKLTSLDISGFKTVKGEGVGMQEMFRLCSSLKTLTFGTGFSTKNFDNLQYMFYSCSSLQSIEADFDISGSNISAMFAHCSKLTKVGTHDGNGAKLYFNGTASVSKMKMLFYSCSSLPYISFEGNVNTSNCTDMSSMFWYCKEVTEINGLTKFDTSNVTTMNSMFSAIAKIEVLDLSSFNTAKVEDMGAMFYCSGEQGKVSRLTTIYVGKGWTTETAFAAAATDSTISTSNVFDNCFMLVGGAGTQYKYEYRSLEYGRIDGGTANPGLLTCVHEIDPTQFVDGSCDVCGASSSN